MYFIQCLDALFNCFREVGPGGFDSRLTPSHGDNVRSCTGLFTTGQQCGGFCAAAGIRFANQSAGRESARFGPPGKARRAKTTSFVRIATALFRLGRSLEMR